MGDKNKDKGCRYCREVVLMFLCLCRGVCGDGDGRDGAGVFGFGGRGGKSYYY